MKVIYIQLFILFVGAGSVICQTDSDKVNYLLSLIDHSDEDFQKIKELDQADVDALLSLRAPGTVFEDSGPTLFILLSKALRNIEPELSQEEKADYAEQTINLARKLEKSENFNLVLITLKNAFTSKKVADFVESYNEIGNSKKGATNPAQQGVGEDKNQAIANIPGKGASEVERKPVVNSGENSTNILWPFVALGIALIGIVVIVSRAIKRKA